MPDLRAAARLVSEGTLDDELAGIVWVLVEHDVPLVVAARNVGVAQYVAQAFAPMAPSVILGESLDDVLAAVTGRAGIGAAAELPDGARELGVVLIVHDSESGPRVHSAHYVRPIERDAACHLQRRPPGLISARDESGRLDHFYWGLTDDLATRAHMVRADLESEHRKRSRLIALAARPEGADARH